jgi:hypothetical protein
MYRATDTPAQEITLNFKWMGKMFGTTAGISVVAKEMYQPEQGIKLASSSLTGLSWFLAIYSHILTHS